LTVALVVLLNVVMALISNSFQTVQVYILGVHPTLLQLHGSATKNLLSTYRTTQTWNGNLQWLRLFGTFKESTFNSSTAKASPHTVCLISHIFWRLCCLRIRTIYLHNW
jgi:hypothetical protein